MSKKRMQMQENPKCQHAFSTAKATIILGLLQRLHWNEREWFERGSYLSSVFVIDREEALRLWAFSLPFPCYCQTCYHVFHEAVIAGRSQQFTQLQAFNPENLEPYIQSKVNQTIVNILPKIYSYYQLPPLK